MRNLNKALEAEQEYLASTNKISLLTLIAPYGYTSLEQFEQDKKIAAIQAADLTPQICVKQHSRRVRSSLPHGRPCRRRV